jgi:hypothetical protein
MGIDDLVDKGKQEVQERGGTDALKEDASEVREDVGEQGSAQDKAKDIAEDVKDPGAPGE